MIRVNELRNYQRNFKILILCNPMKLKNHRHVSWWEIRFNCALAIEATPTCAQDQPLLVPGSPDQNNDSGALQPARMRCPRRAGKEVKGKKTPNSGVDRLWCTGDWNRIDSGMNLFSKCDEKR